MGSSNKKHNRGFLMLDVLIGLFIASIITVAFLGSVVGAVRHANVQAKSVQAELLAIEMLEVARELETSESGWNILKAATHATSTYHPDISSSDTWMLKSGATTTNGFTRSLHVEDVRRNVGTRTIDDVNGSYIDEGTDPYDASRKVTAHVTWPAYGEQPTLTMETYVYEYAFNTQQP